MVFDFAVDISQERMDDFYEDDLEDDLEDEDGLVPSASALVSKDDFRQRWVAHRHPKIESELKGQYKEIFKAVEKPAETLIGQLAI